MRSIFAGAHVQAIAVIAIGLLGIGALVAENPSVVRAATHLISNTCSTAATCYQWTNTSTGAAIRGASDGASGVVGATYFTSTSLNNWKAGLYGNDLSASGLWDRGVYGQTANGWGVFGNATSAQGIGVEGMSTTSAAVVGVSNSGLGVEGISNGADYGVYAISYGGNALYASGVGDGIEAYGGSGNGVYADASTSQAVFAQGGTSEAGWFQTTGGSNIPAIYGNATASGTRGADVTGQYLGAVARAPSGGGTYPLDLTDLSAKAVFYVDGNGDVYYHGTLNTFVRTANGQTALAYGSKTTSPTVEDNGTARLVNGSAVVTLDSTFAAMMDQRAVYQVMLTPDGDTRGLYVQTKSAHYFVVREVQGGHGTLNFDFHIYGASIGTAGVRAAYVNEAAMGPHAPMLRPVSPHVAKVAPPRPK